MAYKVTEILGVHGVLMPLDALVCAEDETVLRCKLAGMLASRGRDPGMGTQAWAGPSRAKQPKQQRPSKSPNPAALNYTAAKHKACLIKAKGESRLR